jgi:hypothetical protein
MTTMAAIIAIMPLIIAIDRIHPDSWILSFNSSFISAIVVVTPFT